MAADKIYIQNGYRASLEIILKDDKGAETSVVFGAYSVDRMSGRVLADGYTAIDKEVYNELLKNSAFNKLVKTNKLIVHETAPASAMSNVDRILALQEENRLLKEENAALKAEKETLKAEKETLKAEKETLKEENAALKAEKDKSKDSDNGHATSSGSKTNAETSGSVASSGGSEATSGGSSSSASNESSKKGK